jgi:4-hydroxy-4-methyl-2-oxoglutarate aldolase
MTGAPLDDAILERLAAVSVSSLCDADKDLGAADAAIVLIADHGPVAGPARIVFAPDDHLPVLRALADASVGEVLVIATNGGRRAVLGELFAAEAVRRGVAGILIDGYCRDLARLREAGVTIYARGTTPASGGTVDIDDAPASIAFAGLAVSAGDLVVADADGVVVAAPSRIVDALDAAEAIERAEARILDAVRGGEPLHAQLTYVEHLEQLRAGRRSALAFVEPRPGRRAG